MQNRFIHSIYKGLLFTTTNGRHLLLQKLITLEGSDYVVPKRKNV